MTDLKIVFNGENSFIDITSSVKDKQVTEQKCLLNVATIKGSDRLYEEKGTNLFKQCIGGVLIDKNKAAHIGAFAALDTLYFINATDNLDFNDPIGLKDIDLNILSHNALSSHAQFECVIYFPDGTKTSNINNILTHA